MGYYNHEAQEHKVNTHPMCTELPAFLPSATANNYCYRYLEERKLDPDLAKENGWFPSDNAGDEFLRIVIPAITHKAGHIYWQARDVSGAAYIRYQSPKGPRHEALVKVIPHYEPKGIVVVEGPMDALAAAGAGFIGYALMGMQPNKATLMHLALLIEDNSELDVLVLLDRDSGPHDMKVSLFLASQGYHAVTGQLPGPEKDLAACLPSKRAKFLSKSFRYLSAYKSYPPPVPRGQNA